MEGSLSAHFSNIPEAANISDLFKSINREGKKMNHLLVVI
jgi:hypothetical protein